MNLHVAEKTGKLLTTLTTTSFLWPRFMVLKCHDNFSLKVPYLDYTYMSYIFYCVHKHTHTHSARARACVCVLCDSVKILKIN